MSGNVQIHIPFALELIRKLKQYPEHGSSKISYYGNTIGKTTLFPYYGL